VPEDNNVVHTIANTSIGMEAEELPVSDNDTVKAEPQTIMKEVCDLIETVVVKLSRQELYDKIWEISVAGVAKKYDIPYSQLMKQVKAANIPIPPSGYWTKLSFGKPVEKTPLTGPKDSVVSLVKAVKTIISHEIVSAPATPKTSKVTQKNIVEKPVLPMLEDDKTKITPVPEEHKPVETYEQCGQTYNIYNREKLYQEVWEKPVTEVAKLYKVSDVTIHKVCKSLDIPTPGLGYWAKVKAGKPVQQTPLPHSDKPATKSGIRTGLEPHPQITAEVLQFLTPEDKSVVLSVATQIILPDEDARMHTKIIAHRKKVVEWHKESRKKDQYWNRRNKDNIPFLADTISEATLPRVCRIFDALIKAMEPLGCSLTDDLKFIVNGETVSLSVSESQDKVEHVPTREENIQLLKYEEEKKKYSWASKPNIRKYDYVYNGKISLAVGGEKSFRDCKSYVIEDRLGDILVQMYEASNTLRIQREAREAAERKREEEERQRAARRERYNREVERTNALVNESEDFEIACRIRAYISAVEQKEELTEEEVSWIAWAKQKADWYDPIMKRKDEFFGARDHGKDANQKKLEKSYSSWHW
jgi:hypothetical protein